MDQSIQQDNSVSMQYYVAPFLNIKCRWDLPMVFSCGEFEPKWLTSFNEIDWGESEYKKII